MIILPRRGRIKDKKAMSFRIYNIKINISFSREIKKNLRRILWVAIPLLVILFGSGIFYLNRHEAGLKKANAPQVENSAGQVAGAQNAKEGEGSEKSAKVKLDPKEVFSAQGESASGGKNQRPDFEVSQNPEIEIVFPEEITGSSKKPSLWQKMFGAKKAGAAEKRISGVTILDSTNSESRDIKTEVEENESGAKIKISRPERAFRPGKYTLSVDMLSADGTQVYTSAQDFTWGVLAINMNKSVYSPGEEAKLQFGVLDENGDMVCDAKLKLEIRNEKGEIEGEFSTEDGRIKVNQDVCQSHEFTLEPDYAAEYKTGEEGKYEMILTAETKNGSYTISDALQVNQLAPFEVERVSATRIYPVNKYPVQFDIITDQDFEGQIVEEVPDNFDIDLKAQNANLKTTTQNSKLITWDIDVKRGDKFTLKYTYDAPDISPEFYLLGPLKFIESEKTIFEEARQWQIAVDAPSQVYDGTNATATQRAGQHKVVRTTNGANGKRTFALFYSAAEVVTLYYCDDPEAGSPTWTSVGTVSTGGNDGSADMEWDTTNNVLYIAYGRETPLDAAASDVNYKIVTALNGTPTLGTERVALNATTTVNFTHPVIEIGKDSSVDEILIYANYYNNSAVNPSAIYLASTPNLNSDNPTFTQLANVKTWTAAAISGIVSVSRTNNNKTVLFYDNGVDLLATQQLDTTDVEATASYCSLGGGTCAGTTTVSADSMAGKMTGSIFGVSNSNAVWFSWLDSAFDINTRRWNGSTLDTEMTPVAGAAVTLGPAIVGDSSNLYMVYQKVSDTTVLVRQSRSLTDGTTAWSGTETTLEDHASENLTYPSICEDMNQNMLDVVYTTATNATIRHMSVSFAPPVVVSGTSGMRTGDTVKVAIGGSVYGTTGTIDSGTGNWSISVAGTDISSGKSVIVWTDTATAGNQSTAISKWDGSGDMTGMVLDANVLSVGSANSSGVASAEVDDFTCASSGGGNVMHAFSSSTLSVDGCSHGYSAEKIDILASNTLTIGASEILTTYDLTITGTLTSGGASTYNVSHNWVNNGTTFTASTSTVNMNGSTAQAINGSTSTTFNNLALSNSSAAVSVNTSEVVNGTLTVNASNILTPAAAAVISGSGTLTGSGTVQVTRTAATASFGGQYSITNKTLTGLTVEYTGTGQVLTNLTYGNLTISSNAIATGTNDATVGGIFTVGASGVFTPSGGTMIFNNGSSIANSGSLTFQGLTIEASAAVSANTNNFGIAGTFTVNGSATFTPGASTIINSAGAAGTITGTGTVQVTRTDATPDYSSQYKFTTNTLSGLTVDYTSASAQTISAVNYGNLSNSGNGNRTLASSGTIGISGTFTKGSGTYTVTGSTVNYSGAGQTVAQITYNHLTLSGSGTVTMTGVTAVNGDFTASGGTINAPLTSVGGNILVSGGTVTTSGNLAVTGSTTVSSGSLTQGAVTYSTASLTCSGTGTVTTAGAAFTVSGTTTVSGGTVHLNNNTGTKLLTGAVSVSSGTLDGNSSAIEIRNGITQSSGSVAITGTATFTTNAQEVKGTISIANITATTINLTNGSTGTGALTVSTTLGGSGTFTNGATGTLNYGATAAPTVTTFTMNTSGNTMNYTGANSVIRTVAYHHLGLTGSGTITGANFTVTAIGGNLSVSGSVGVTTGAALAVTGTTTVGTGTSLTIGAFTTSMPNITVTSTGTMTNNGTLTVSTTLAGTGGFTNGASGTLNFGASTIDVSTFTASASGNTVNYTGGAQTVKATATYHHLTLSGSGAKTLTATTTAVNGNLTLSGTASTTLVVSLAVAGQVTVGTGTTLGLGSSGYTLTLSGSGTGTSRPLYMNGGALTEGTNSTVKFTGTAATDIQNETYWHLELSPSGGSTPTYTLATGGSQTITTQNLTIGNGTNGVSVTAAANNPVLDINGDFSMLNGGSFTGGSQTITVGTDTTLNGDFTLANGATWNAGSGTLILDGGDDSNLIYFNDQNGTKQNMGAVQIGASPATTNMSSDMSATNLTVASGDRLNTRGYDITLTDYLTVSGTGTLNVNDSSETDDTFITLGGNFTMSGTGTYSDDDGTPNDSVIVFTGNASADQTFATGSKSYGRVTLNNTQGTYDDIIVSGTLDLNSTAAALTITDGNLQLATNDPAVTIAGNVSIASAGLWTKQDTGSPTVTFDGSSQTFTDSSSGGPQDIGLVVVATSLATNSNAKMTKVTINSGKTLDISGDNLTLTGSGSGTSRPFYNNGGTFTEGTNSTVTFTGTSASDIQNETYYNLTLAPAGTVTYTQLGSITVTGKLTVGDASNAVTFTTNNQILDLNGDFEIKASALFTAPSSAAFTLFGNYTNSATGTFTDSGGLLTLDGSAAQSFASGGTDANHDFQNLTVANSSGKGGGAGVTFSDSTTVNGTFADNTQNSKLIFAITKTFAFANIDIDGAAGNTIVMTSTNATPPGSGHSQQWYFTVTQSSPTVTYVEVYDSDAEAGNDIICYTSTGCVDQGNNQYWIFAPPGTDISGISNMRTGDTVKVAINGTVNASTGTINVSNGNWSLTTVGTVGSGDSVIIWTDTATAGNQSTAVTKYDGADSISGMVLNANVLSIGSGDNANVASSEFGDFTCGSSGGGNVMYSFSSSTLNLEGCAHSYTAEKIDILASNTLTISGTETLTTHDVGIGGTLASGGNSAYNVSGSWDNNAVFTASTSTIIMTATSGTETIDSTGASTATFNNLNLGSGSGTAQWNLSSALDVNGTLTVDYGTLSNGANNVALAGSLAINANGNYTAGAGTFTFDGTTGPYNWTNAGTVDDLGAVAINGSSNHVDLGSSVKATSINIAGSQTLDANGANTITLTGSGRGASRPFITSGTFTSTGSTVSYTGTSDSDIENLTYNNLALAPPSGSPTYYLNGTDTVSGNMAVGNGSNAVTLNSNDQTLNVSGDFEIKASGTFVAPTNSSNITLYGNVTIANGGIYTKSSGTGKLILEGDAGTETFEDLSSPKQDLGAVQIGLSPGTTNLKSDMVATSLTINASDTLNTKGYEVDIGTGGISIASGSPGGTLNTTDTGSGGENDGTIVTDEGNFTIGSGGVYTKDSTGAQVSLLKMDGGTTKTFTSASNDIGHFQTSTASTHIDLQDAGNFDNVTIDSSTTLDSNGYDITVGGNWANSGSFTAGSKKVTFDAASTGFTIDSGGTGTGKTFYDVVFNNASGGWTVQTSNVLISNNLTFTSVSSWANSKSINIRVGGTLTVAANQDIRMWNSSAANGYSVDSSGSLYSMDHNSADGTLYVWGDYHVNTNDYWSYATDFDNTALGASSRSASVWVDPSATITVDSGDTLNSIGQDSGMTIVNRQGSSGGYGIVVASGGTINFNYTDFEYLKGTSGKGIDIQSGASVAANGLDYCKFNNFAAHVGASDAFITVDPGAITVNRTFNHVQFDNTSGSADYNINRTGTGTSNYWSFTNYTGLWAGAGHELENDASDMIRWTSTIDTSGGQDSIEGAATFEGAAAFQ
jgi:hypothetical protein